MSRKLATIQRIKDIQPIPNADRIEVATVNGWKVVVGKNVGHQVGDLVVYCEIDSFLPVEPEFEFLRKSSYKKLADGSGGFRLKTIKMRGQVSQGLIIPLKDAEEVAIRQSIPNEEKNFEIKPFKEMEVGTDVSNLLGITKYDPPLPAQLEGEAKGYFPSYIPKTDEERIQNLTEEYPGWINSDKTFYSTEKLDGTSATYFIKDGEFGVCSRNLELLETENNTFWRVARELKVEEKLRSLDGDYALQGELIGEGIQKNPYKLKGQTVRFFNLFNITEYKREPFSHLLNTLTQLDLLSVPVLLKIELPDSIDKLIEMADGKSFLNEDVYREGIVVRSYDQQISFKVISNKFLLKQ